MESKINLVIQSMKAPVSFLSKDNTKNSFKQDKGIGVTLSKANKFRRFLSILVYIVILILLSAMFAGTFNVDRNTAGITAVID
jgi:hypothetical protein